MRTAYIHIGMHKTGSSSIQQTLSRLDMPAHHYVRQGAPNHSVNFATVFETDPKTSLLLENGASPEDIATLKKDWRRALKRELGACEKPNIVFSAEAIASDETSDEALKRLKALFEQYADRIVVIGYVRAPVSQMTSALQQMVKAGRAETLDPVPPRYRARLARIDRVFGRENVNLIPFDPNAFPGADVVQDFAHRIGIEIAPEAIRRVNEAISLEAVAVLYARRRFGLDFGSYEGKLKDRNHVVKLAARLGQTRFRLSPSVIDPIMARIGADLDWIEARIGQPIRDSAVDHPDAISSEAELLSIAEKQQEALLSLLNEDIGAQRNRAHSVAEMLDMAHLLARSRARGPASSKSLRMAGGPQRTGN